MIIRTISLYNLLSICVKCSSVKLFIMPEIGSHNKSIRIQQLIYFVFIFKIFANNASFLSLYFEFFSPCYLNATLNNI